MSRLEEIRAVMGLLIFHGPVYNLVDFLCYHRYLVWWDVQSYWLLSSFSVLSSATEEALEMVYMVVISAHILD